MPLDFMCTRELSKQRNWTNKTEKTIETKSLTLRRSAKTRSLQTAKETWANGSNAASYAAIETEKALWKLAAAFSFSFDRLLLHSAPVSWVNKRTLELQLCTLGTQKIAASKAFHRNLILMSKDSIKSKWDYITRINKILIAEIT